jgi:hypothetical protein
MAYYIDASVAYAAVRAAWRPIELASVAPFETHVDVVDLSRFTITTVAIVCLFYKLDHFHLLGITTGIDECSHEKVNDHVTE